MDKLLKEWNDEKEPWKRERKRERKGKLGMNIVLKKIG